MCITFVQDKHTATVIWLWTTHIYLLPRTKSTLDDIGGMESASQVIVPLRSGGKKMRKRRELDALVAHSLGKR